MRKPILKGVFLGALITMMSVSAAFSAQVTLRVEGQNDTVLSERAVELGSSTTAPDGTHSCGSGSVANAINVATSGNWQATYSPWGYTLDGISGENYPFVGGADPSYYWSIWVNNQAASVSVCDENLSAGDSVLVFVDCYSGTGLCSSLSPLSLSLSSPTVSTGGSVTATVLSYAWDGTSSPVEGATVSGGGVSVTTDSSGQATISGTQASLLELQATKSGFVRTAKRTLCIHGEDGVCGSTTAAAVQAQAQANGTAVSSSSSGGSSQSPTATADKVAPVVKIASVTKKRYRIGKAPRTLSGSVEDPGGLRWLKLRVTRKLNGHCSWFSGRSRKFRAKRCGSSEAPFGIETKDSWSYLLPKQLPKGAYTLEVLATDKSWNRKIETVNFTVQ